MAASHNLDRRDFVSIVLISLGAIMGAMIGLPALGYLISPATKAKKSEAWIPLGALQIYPVGVPTLFNFTRTSVNGWEKTTNSYGAYVVRSGESDVKVYSNICTHLSCRVTWKEERGEYQCPCHDAHFDMSGKVLSGPPPAPLQEYETRVEDANLFIHVREG